MYNAYDREVKLQAKQNTKLTPPRLHMHAFQVSLIKQTSRKTIEENKVGFPYLSR